MDKHATYTHLDVDQLRAERDQALNQLLNQTAKNMAGQSAGTVRSRVGDCMGHSYYQSQYCSEIHWVVWRLETRSNGRKEQSSLISRYV